MKKNSGFTKRVLDMKNTRKTLNFRPYYSLYEGLHETWNWYLKNKNESRKEKITLYEKKIKNLKSILINFEKDIKNNYEKGKSKLRSIFQVITKYL